MAYEQLVKKLLPKLKGIVYRLSSRSVILNDKDLLQEALLYLWLEFKQGRLEGNTDSYILQGCYFYLKNYLRKYRSKARLVSIEELVTQENLSLYEILSSDDYDPQQEKQELDNRMLIDRIRNNGLTPREKQVFLLWLEGLTTREIGHKLAVSHVRVVKLQNSIKEKCQKYRD